jgi:hypothetical protein
MLSVVVLICSISTQPQVCTESSALATLHGGEVNNVVSCGLEAQAMLGRSALKPTPGQEYAKIECQPRNHRREQRAESLISA